MENNFHESWLIFAGMFGLLGLIHAYRVFGKIDEIPSIPGMASMNGVPNPAVKLREEVNSFVRKFNKENFWGNMLAVTGYTITAITALAAYFFI